ncbi:MAG: hypothetical protein E7447_02150 [Ruminococcaceae bacterium]|nr:hypothetical protein [Oscillospiraceae bacterium]
MKKVLCIVAVLLALSLVLIPAPTASAAGQAPGEQVTFTYSHENVYGLSGTFTYEDPSNIIEDLSYDVQTTFTNGSLQNDRPFYYSNKPESITITVSFKISAQAPHESYCKFVFDYDLADQYGDTERKIDEQKIVVYIPGLPTTPSTQPTTAPSQPGTQPSTAPSQPGTQPSTAPSQPGTQPTQPGTQPTQPTTRPSQPGTQPTQPGTQPTQSTQPSQPGTKPTQPGTKPTQPLKPGELDFSELRKQIALAYTYNEMDYTAASWANLMDALAKAEAALNAKTQDEIDAAAAALAEAIKNLVALDYKPLTDAISATESFLKGDALGGKLAILLDRLNEAKALLGNARDQESINAAAAALAAALADLEQALKDLVGKTEIVEVEPSGDYCNISMHYVWPILFFISLALNLVFAGVAVYLFRRKKKESDDTPLVDYDIGEDA